MRTYYNEMGIDTAALMPLLLSTPHTGVHRMTPEERRTTRIVTRVAAGDELLQTASLEVDRKPDTAAPAATNGPGAAAPLKLVTEVRPVYPSSGEAIELFIRVKASDPPAPGAHYAADIVFAGGKTLIATSDRRPPGRSALCRARNGRLLRPAPRRQSRDADFDPRCRAPGTAGADRG